MKYSNIGYIVSRSLSAQNMLRKFLSKYNIEDVNTMTSVDVVLVFGGDGFMLRAAHQYMPLGTPLYGINAGTVGFLMNDCDLAKEDDLYARIENAYIATLYPLHALLENCDKESFSVYAINEVSLFRATHRNSYIQILVNNVLRMEKLAADGILISTPVGSSGYNYSAGGAIFPFYSKVIAVTPISPFRPRRWKGAMLPDNVNIDLEVLDPQIRPVNVVADYQEFKEIRKICVQRDSRCSVRLLFDSQISLEEKIIREQFV